ncbi:MAG TPA: phage holin family protein [Steroidobacteraceae bacterium]
MARSTHSPTIGNGHSTTPMDAESPVGLLRRLADDVTDLLRKELALATSEVSQTVETTRSGLVSLAAGGGVLFAGLLFLLGAATAALAQIMDLWLASLIVGAVVTLIGLIMVASGRKKMKPDRLKLERTRDSLRSDAHLMSRRPS